MVCHPFYVMLEAVLYIIITLVVRFVGMRLEALWLLVMVIMIGVHTKITFVAFVASEFLGVTLSGLPYISINKKIL
jgi:hypothetical protein